MIVPVLGKEFPAAENTRRLCMRSIANFIFLLLFAVLAICWLIAWAAFHVVGGGIHLLLIVAVIFLVIHFVRGRRTI
jgi:hypothetical protein